jgi:manganese/zinc/iron transport system substrate-binding protein
MLKIRPFPKTHRMFVLPALPFCRVVFCVLSGVVLLIGCAEQKTRESSATDPLRVVATVGMVADLVKAVGGDDVEVTQLMGPGVDPHLYKPTRDDVFLITDADMVFSCGLMLEGRLQETLDRIGETKPVVTVTSKLPQELLLVPEDAGGHPDPHVWMDVAAWSNCLDPVVEALTSQRPAMESKFRERAAEYQKTLQGLHEYGLTCMASIPDERRVLITSHDAFNYFGRAYGVEVLGVQGISTDSEAGLKQINELVDLLVERKVSAVFVESSVPQKNILALIDGAKARGHDVKVGGELYSDAMGASGTYEGTYAGMLDHNITSVTRSLGGTAPEKGFGGRLSESAAAP